MHVMHSLVLSLQLFALHFNCLFVFVCVCEYILFYDFALKFYVKFFAVENFQPLEYKRFICVFFRVVAFVVRSGGE